MFNIGDRVRLKDGDSDETWIVYSVFLELNEVSILGFKKNEPFHRVVNLAEIVAVDQNTDIKQAIREVLLSDQFVKTFAGAISSKLQQASVSAEQPEQPAIKQSLTTKPPDGWRPNDNVSLAMQMAANSFGGKDGVFNGANFSNAMRKLAGVNCNLDGHVVATILEGRSDVEVLKGGSHYRYLLYESINSSQEPAEPPKPTVEVAVEVTGEVKNPIGCPEGWRFLEVGEVIRKGDRGFENGLLYAIEPMKIGVTLQSHWMPTIRRNRFEVGEKVVDCRTGLVRTVQGTDKQYSIVFLRGFPNGIESKHLAPCIEDTK